MRRRTLVGSMAGAAALVAGGLGRATTKPRGNVPSIGVLRWGVPSDEARDGLTGALGAIGYREGTTIKIEWRWATRPEDAQRHAVELVGMGLDLLVASATPAAQALRGVTATIPVILATAADPVGAGLVVSLARPGGNVTGVSSNLPALVPKQFQLLREILPSLQRVAFLGSTDDIATPIFVAQAESAARALGIQLQLMLIGQASEFESAANAMSRERAQAVVVQPLFTLGQSGPLADVLGRRKLPSVSGLRPFVLAGGLMTFGPNRAEQWRRSASFVDRVLKGAQPAALPVEEPTTFELALNMKTARAIGLTIPQTLLLRADEVIQ